MFRKLSCPECGSAWLEPVFEAEPFSEYLCGVCRAVTASPPRATLAARVLTRARRAGLRSLTSLALDALVDVRRYLLFEVSSEETIRIEAPGGVEIDDLRPVDLDGLARFVPRSELERRLARGEHGIVARSHGQPVGCVWLAAEPRTRTFPLPIVLAEGEIYADGLYVRSSERNRGIGTALSAARRGRARSLGFSSVVAHARVENVAIHRVQAAQGAVRLGGVAIVILLGRRRLVRQQPGRG